MIGISLCIATECDRGKENAREGGISGVREGSREGGRVGGTRGVPIPVRVAGYDLFRLKIPSEQQ